MYLWREIMRAATILPIVLPGLAHGHGDWKHGQKPIVSEDATWMEKHMAEEHHIATFDSGAFFALHDYNSDGEWHGEEVMRTYGLMDESNKHMSQDQRLGILQKIMGLLDTNGDGIVTRNEFTDYIAHGGTLPDLDTGPGHHGDDEYEYEIHHWEKYHDANTKLEDLTHPEDIEHFKHHEEMEDLEEELEAMHKRTVIEENIPVKFRRQS